MHELNKEKMMTVVLLDIMDTSLPRILSIRTKLDNGEVLSDLELDFIHVELDKVTRFYRDFQEEDQCGVIYSHYSHMLSEVMRVALENERLKD